MRKLILTNQFKRAYKTYVASYPYLIKKIDIILEMMEQDVFQKSLFTHKLSGKLYSYRSCSCGYNCRIVFRIELNPNTLEEEIILIDIGTHDIVY